MGFPATGRFAHGMLGPMRRGTWAEDPSAIAAVSRDGVIRAATLERLGVAKGTISSRCNDGGPWQRILPGVVLLHNGPPTTLQRNLAALEYGGPDALLSGHAALAAFGYTASASRNDVLLLIPSSRHRRDWSYVKVERTWRMPEPVHRGLLRLAPPARSLLDAGRRTVQADSCRALLAGGIQRGDVTVDELARELAQGSDRGSRLPRAVLRDLSDDAHSVAEVHAQRLYATSGLPPMRHNVDVLSAAGLWIARPDGWLDDVAVAWEIDSLKYHFSPELHEATVRRRARMQREGIIVVTHLPRQIQTDPSTVLADLRAAYSLAASRPRPPVFVHTEPNLRSA
ncbi:hypothetical protein SAMN04490220_5065 [Rhodococcus jostii]|uniref:Transcriptional regulator, AbiEi antitoxin, Type IV TA system n=2 Tax=Rhodococcus jostii TaxID=132919 RepID=A0A1H5CCE0_RHOJO|nr:hypothetical protein SAMN04490220_5065 [Rhodococcus jostii]